jgi:hypothetical protein
MTARIYRPAPSATQSGAGVVKPWLLVFEQESARQIDPLMGWTSSSDMKGQIKLRFASEEEAIAYAQRNGIVYTVVLPKPETASRSILSYSDNFNPNRKGLWTH